MALAEATPLLRQHQPEEAVGRSASRPSRGKVRVRSLSAARGRMSPRRSRSAAREAPAVPRRGRSPDRTSSRGTTSSAPLWPRLSRSRVSVFPLGGRRRVRRSLATSNRDPVCAKRTGALGWPCADRPLSGPPAGLTVPRRAEYRRGSLPRDVRRRRGMATDLERFVDAPGREDLVKRSTPPHRRRGHHLHLLPVHLGHRPDHGQGRARAALGDDGAARASSSSTGRPRTCSSTATASTSATGPEACGAGRHARAGDVPGAAVGPEGRARLVHVLPRARGREDGGSFLSSDCRGNLKRIQAEFEAAHRPAPARRHRAGDDVAQDEAGRHARRRGHDEALLLPHRPVLRAAADHPQGDRVRPGDGSRHDPGRPRGRARPARAELQLRPGREDGRQPLHLPPDLQAGRARAERVPVLHAEAVHGRLGQRLPPQHLALAGRRERVHAGGR